MKVAGTPVSGSGSAKVVRRLRFGEVRTSAVPREKAVKIRNRSRTDRLVVRVDAATGPFSGGGVTYDIAPRTALKLGLAFDPSVAGAEKQTLTITTSDPERPSLQLELSGAGK